MSIDDESRAGTCVVCGYLNRVSQAYGGTWPKHLADASAEHIKRDHEPACS